LSGCQLATLTPALPAPKRRSESKAKAVMVTGGLGWLAETTAVLGAMSRGANSMAGPGHQRVFLRMHDPLQIQVHVKFRPVKVLAMMKFDVEQLA